MAYEFPAPDDWPTNELLKDMGPESALGVMTDEDQTKRRTFYRAAFAYLEADMFVLRGCCLELAQAIAEVHGDQLYTAAEVLLLREETPRVADNGTVKLATRHLPMNKGVSLRFTINMGLRIFETLSDWWVERTNWETQDRFAAYKRAVIVRHRLTHPKRLSDTHIDKDSIMSLVSALNWYRGMSILLAESFENRYAELTAELSARIGPKTDQMTDNETRNEGSDSPEIPREPE